MIYIEYFLIHCGVEFNVLYFFPDYLDKFLSWLLTAVILQSQEKYSFIRKLFTGNLRNQKNEVQWIITVVSKV